MIWIGPLVGAVLGLLSIRGVPGLILGLIAGHLIGQFLRPFKTARHINFLDPLFGLIGAMAKADGAVSQAEIDATEHLMRRLCLDPAQRREAIARFNAGKQSGFAIHVAIADLKTWCGGRRDHAYILIDVLLDVVYAEGGTAAARMAVLRALTQALGIDDRELASLAAMRGRRWQAGQGHAGAGSGNHARPPPPVDSPDPYTVLGIAADADNRAIKRAYRKLISQHHPDKLGDVPDALRRRAEERAREINTAYERIKSARGFV
ncbi:co-chaperone DjlA [Tahibacter amnicola]|uniref:Co-chaperone DjlA n=1 Tax=Tahibacter amnicola TaxID=2976241 RepID=A0ABY6BFQ5_9GAMM|nr:co-chaperone DjlA [Tahibacter amnicola]UXI68856.1 co-chaperone DjlA [Tahibacter amnicola]